MRPRRSLGRDSVENVVGDETSDGEHRARETPTAILKDSRG